MAIQRQRTKLYQGPKNSITRDELAALEGTHAFEEKHDGFWCCVTVVGGAIVSGESRVGLNMDCGEVEGFKLRVPCDGQLVGELTADLVNGERCGTRRLHLFDLLSWNGYDLRDLTLVERREVLEKIHQEAIGANEFVSLVEHRRSGGAAFFDEVVARKGEGVVAKLLTSKYRPANADGKIEEWVRCKPVHAVDFVVMGHGLSKKTTTQPGGSPNIALGLWKDCKVQGRKLVKVQDCCIPSCFNGVDLDSIVGTVVEVTGAEIWPSGCVRHGHITRPRPDKVAEDCTHEAAMAA